MFFDNVLVPWDRVFMYQDPLLYNRAFAETNAVVHMMHQVACGKLAKTEFLGVLWCAMAHASGKDKDIGVKGQIAEIMWIADRTPVAGSYSQKPDLAATTSPPLSLRAMHPTGSPKSKLSFRPLAGS